ncbi:glycosyltransferase [Variovorax sp. KBS0712]|uniref:glycosyltransferase n=1 Tax=Variovorax sp. KBS0712 TaxID=2578111 RepID=UPI00163D3E5E|nr:glycosyltransferase [Variovorax sp. KBS0712]
MNPRVSILVAAWNAAAYIAETIQSVQSQSFASWELILVDDGSTDETAEISRKYATSDQRIKIYQQPNQGAHIARNYAFSKSSGDYVVILDADDRILPKKIETQVKILDSNLNYDVVYGDTWHCDQFMNRVVLESKKYPAQHISGDIFDEIILGNRFAVHAGMVRRVVLEDVGLHDPNPNLIADWDFWVRVAEKYRFFYDNQVVAEYRIHPGMSANIDSGKKQFHQRMNTVANIERLSRYALVSRSIKNNIMFANARFAQKYGLHAEAIEIAKKMIFDQPLRIRNYLLYGYSLLNKCGGRA